jgi:hypothetical protein
MAASTVPLKKIKATENILHEQLAQFLNEAELLDPKLYEKNGKILDELEKEVKKVTDYHLFVEFNNAQETVLGKMLRYAMEVTRALNESPNNQPLAAWYTQYRDVILYMINGIDCKDLLIRSYWNNELSDNSIEWSFHTGDPVIIRAMMKKLEFFDVTKSVMPTQEDGDYPCYQQEALLGHLLEELTVAASFEDYRNENDAQAIIDIMHDLILQKNFDLDISTKYIATFLPGLFDTYFKAFFGLFVKRYEYEPLTKLYNFLYTEIFAGYFYISNEEKESLLERIRDQDDDQKDKVVKKIILEAYDQEKAVLRKQAWKVHETIYGYETALFGLPNTCLSSEQSKSFYNKLVQTDVLKKPEILLKSFKQARNELGKIMGQIYELEIKRDKLLSDLECEAIIPLDNGFDDDSDNGSDNNQNYD